MRENVGEGASALFGPAETASSSGVSSCLLCPLGLAVFPAYNPGPAAGGERAVSTTATLRNRPFLT